MIDERHGALESEIHRDAARSRDEPYGLLAGEVTDAGDTATADLISNLDNAELSRDRRHCVVSTASGCTKRLTPTPPSPSSRALPPGKNPERKPIDGRSRAGHARVGQLFPFQLDALARARCGRSSEPPAFPIEQRAQPACISRRGALGPQALHLRRDHLEPQQPAGFGLEGRKVHQSEVAAEIA